MTAVIHFSGFVTRNRNPLVLFSLLILMGILFSQCCIPASAASYTYLDSNAKPNLVARSSGNVQYYPGTTFNLTVILTNKGRDTAMQIAPLLSPGAYVPSTALGVTITPDSGDAPVTLKSLPIVAGNIGSWDEVPVTISGYVHQDAHPGIYPIQLTLSYNYVYAIPMTGDAYSSINKLYNQIVQTLPVRIRVMSEIKPSIISQNYYNLVPGTQGYLELAVQNIGFAAGNEVSFSISPSDNSSLQMVDSGIYLGRFRPDEIANIRARIGVKEHVAAGSYPAKLEGQYKDEEGIIRTIQSVPLGIAISRGAVFEEIARNQTIGPGETDTITIDYKNSGDKPAFNAQARIIGNQVIKPVVDTVVLGNVSPGETKTAIYTISAEAPIVEKWYDVDTEVKYRDELDTLMLSDKMSFGVLVEEPSGPGTILTNPIYIILIVGTFAILVYVYWKIRQNKKSKETM